MTLTLVALDAAHLVGIAAIPVLEAPDAPLPPQVISARVRPALETLAGRSDLGWKLQLEARAALSAACGVERREPRSYSTLVRSIRSLLGLVTPTPLASDAIQLVGIAAIPVIEALDAPLPPPVVAARVRPPLETLAERKDLGWDLQLGVRAALSAACGVERREPRSYAALLRSIRGLLELAGLPVPSELAESN